VSEGTVINMAQATEVRRRDNIDAEVFYAFNIFREGRPAESTRAEKPRRYGGGC
jgi:hypothetical protein